MTPQKADAQRSAMLRIGNGVVIWWSPIDGRENVGDYLTFYFLNRLFSGVRLEADVYRLVGSVIAPGVIASDVETVARKSDAQIAFWACGCREDRELPKALLQHAHFFGVRGPLTRDLLRLPADTPLGDPALLLPLVHAPRPSASIKGKTIFIPHIRDMLGETPARLLALSQADMLVSPIVDSSLAAVEQFIDEVCSADFVIAGSLHAAIIACAYGVPFSFFDTGYVDQPFKWRDFAASVDIGTHFPRSRRDAELVYQNFIEGRVKRPPLAPLLGCAPMLPQPALVARAAAHAWTA